MAYIRHWTLIFLSFSFFFFFFSFFPFPPSLPSLPRRLLFCFLRAPLSFLSAQDLVYGANSGGHAISTTAHVTAVFETSDGTEILFTRTITGKGGSQYRLDQKVVTWDEYNAKLESLDLIVKARNFLVFQGDVESIAQKTPVELAKLFENISGSDEL